MYIIMYSEFESAWHETWVSGDLRPLITREPFVNKFDCAFSFCVGDMRSIMWTLGEIVGHEFGGYD